MTKHKLLTKEHFDSLLLWFSEDREEAGAKYEEIRVGLIRFFDYKGCSDSENLADETINRVARKLSALDTSNGYRYLTYFYGFASKVYLEYRKKIERNEVELDQNIHFTDESSIDFDEIQEIRQKFLEQCLATLSAEDKYVIIQYFAKEGQPKAEHRRRLAEELKISPGICTSGFFG